MSRKKYTRVEEETPAVQRLREKRKWQINLRRYVLEGQHCPQYAPYFGLDIENIRKWFAAQFSGTQSWENFGKAWQFEHILPVNCFDFNKEEDLRLCWNFINLRVAPISNAETTGNPSIQSHRKYFEELHQRSGYSLCSKMLHKIEEIEAGGQPHSHIQAQFLLKNRSYLDQIEDFTAYEFELLNSGRSLAEVLQEQAVLKTIGAPKQ